MRCTRSRGPRGFWKYVIIRESIASGYFDGWGALGCVYDVAKGDAGTARVKGFLEKEEALCSVSAEGGWLVDYDKKHLIVFGYTFPNSEMSDLEGNVESHVAAANEALDNGGVKAFVKHVSEQWPGWTIVWDDNGLEAFADHLESNKIEGVRIMRWELHETSSNRHVFPAADA